MTYDQWKCRDPNDTGFYDMPEDDGPTELDIAYQRIEELVKAMNGLYNWYDSDGSVGAASDVFERHREVFLTAVGSPGVKS